MLILLALMFSLYAEATKIKVVTREAINGGLFGYDYVTSNLVTYTTEYQGKEITHVGYEVTCAKPGWTSCPKLGAEYRPSTLQDNWDQTQVNKADELMNYALQKMAYGVQSGTYNLQVQVQGELLRRIYEVVWDARTGKVEIFREDVSL